MSVDANEYEAEYLEVVGLGRSDVAAHLKARRVPFPARGLFREKRSLQKNQWHSAQSSIAMLCNT